jgi:hypothetical protein
MAKEKRSPEPETSDPVVDLLVDVAAVQRCAFHSEIYWSLKNSVAERLAYARASQEFKDRDLGSSWKEAMKAIAAALAGAGRTGGCPRCRHG